MTNNNPPPMPEMPDLLPCPFCGGAAVCVTGPIKDAWGVSCIQCDCWCDFREKTDVAAAIEWNKRADLSRPRLTDDEVEKLKLTLKDMVPHLLQFPATIDGVSAMLHAEDKIRGWNDCIDHLRQRGII